MLPQKVLNIYPKTEENLNALLSFYFDEYDLPKGKVIEVLMNKTSLSVNEIEFIARKLSQCYKLIFKDFFKSSMLTIEILMNYGIEALTIDENEWKGSKPRVAKLKEFRQYVKSTEKQEKE